MAESSISTPPPPAQSSQPPRDRSSTLSSIRKVAGTAGKSALNVLNADPPLGAWAATAQASSQAPTLTDIRRGSFDEYGWTGGHGSRPQSLRANSQRGLARRTRAKTGTAQVRRSSVEQKPGEDISEPFPTFEEVETPAERESLEQTGVLAQEAAAPAPLTQEKQVGRARANTSGYVPPPHLPWTISSWIGFKAFLKWTTRPLGFLITIYALNVVAWGGMLFLLLCNAGPAMCNAPDGQGGTVFDCDNLYSPRRVWIEIDSQILNALFCVTGFGLIPWRFRDLYYLLRWRLCSEQRYGSKQKLFGLRKLAGINRGWFRLPNSDTLDEISPVAHRSAALHLTQSGHVTTDNEEGEIPDDSRLPIPLAKAPADPLTGVRAPPTALWKLDFFIWCQVMNTFLQAVLCGFMWGYSRFTRPSWATGLFIGLACIVAGIGGIVSYVEGRRVKRVEGVRPSAAEQREILKMQRSQDAALLENPVHQTVTHESEVVTVDPAKK